MTLELAPFASVVLRLLQGVVAVDDEREWSQLLRYQTAIDDYVSKIGLSLIIDEADGFAYLHQPKPTSDDENPALAALPRLTRSRALSYFATVLCVALREQINVFDSSPQRDDVLIVSREDMRQMVIPYVRENADQKRTLDRIDAAIKQVTDLGFLRKISAGRGGGQDDDTYQVRRVIKAKIGSDQLVEIREKLKAYGTQSDLD